MKYYGYIDPETGRGEKANIAPEGVQSIEIDANADANLIALSPAGEVVLRPPRAEDWLVWDWVSLAWIDGRDDAYYAEKMDADFATMRRERDRRLTACDWTQVSDAPLTDEQKTAWAAYRQALRDLPENTTDPANPVWPDKP